MQSFKTIIHRPVSDVTVAILSLRFFRLSSSSVIEILNTKKPSDTQVTPPLFVKLAQITENLLFCVKSVLYSETLHCK